MSGPGPQLPALSARTRPPSSAFSRRAPREFWPMTGRGRWLSSQSERGSHPALTWQLASHGSHTEAPLAEWLSPGSRLKPTLLAGLGWGHSSCSSGREPSCLGAWCGWNNTGGSLLPPQPSATHLQSIITLCRLVLTKQRELINWSQDQINVHQLISHCSE